MNDKHRKYQEEFLEKMKNHNGFNIINHSYEYASKTLFIYLTFNYDDAPFELQELLIKSELPYTFRYTNPIERIGELKFE